MFYRRHCRGWSATPSLVLVELTLQVIRPTESQRLHLLDAPAAAVSRLNRTELGAVLLSGGFVRGRTAVVGTPYYGDRHVGKLALAELLPSRCEIASIAGVSVVVWSASLTSGFGSRGAAPRWSAAVRARQAALSCSTHAALAQLLQSVPQSLGAAAILLLGDVADGSSDFWAHALNWPFPEADPEKDRPGDVVIPTLWLSGEAGDRFAAALTLGNISHARERSSSASSSASSNAQATHEAAAQGLLGIRAELSWNVARRASSSDASNNRVVSDGWNMEAAVSSKLGAGSLVASDGDLSMIDATSHGLKDVVQLSGDANVTDVVDLELWANPVDAAANMLIHDIAVALRPLRHQIRLVRRWALRKATARDSGTNHCALVDSSTSVCLPSWPISTSSGALPLTSVRAILEEVARQKCLRSPDVWEGLTGDGINRKAVLWEYLERFHAYCLVARSDVTQGQASKMRECSVQQLESLGASSASVIDCSEKHFRELLVAETGAPQPGLGADVAIRIAGWAYTSPLHGDLVFDAVCGALSSTISSGIGPPACGKPWLWRSPRWFVMAVPMWPHGVVSLATSFFVPLLLPCLCRTVGSRWRKCRSARRTPPPIAETAAPSIVGATAE